MWNVAMYTITAALALSFALFSLKAFHTFILVSLHICYLVLHAPPAAAGSEPPHEREPQCGIYTNLNPVG